VVTRTADLTADGVIALDTDSRLLSPDEAARAVSSAITAITPTAWRLIYKKTDSVLRGPVLAELAALAIALGRPRVLLVPCNPGLGRTIRDGRYFIGDTPLDQTAFARDPHHPARTAVVSELLRWSADAPVHVLPPDAPLPATGVIVGEASTADDVQAWATRLTDDTLPAGGGEFFAAVLRRVIGSSPTPAAAPPPLGPTLIVTGSLAAPRRAPNTLVLPSAAEVLAALAQIPVVAIGPPAERVNEPAASARIRRSLAAAVCAAAQRRAFRHLLVEGGATAAEILASLGWTRLAVTREWAQGVVTLQPEPAPQISVTMKPGSYAWPDPLWRLADLPV
jgi:uncharacterized protein YgbK (DUF1537 family)